MNTESTPPKPKRNWRVLILLAVIGVAILAGVLLWNSPLRGKRLPAASVSRVPTQPLSTATRTSPQAGEQTPSPAASTSQPATATPQADLAAAPTRTMQPRPVCGGPDQMLVLALGIDLSAQADVIRLMRIDFVEQKVRVLSIPRDFWVPIPGFEEKGISMGRISAAYGYGEYYHGEGKGNGVIAVANALYANYGVQFDRYVVVPMGSMAKWVDRVGGVDVVVKEAIDGRASGLSYFGEGDHHLDGEKALEYALIQEASTESERVNRQSELLRNLYAKAMDSMNLVQLTSLGIEVISDKSILTDLSPSDISALSCLGKRLTKADTEMVEIPKEMYEPATTEGGGSVLAPHAEVVAYVQEMMEIP